MRIFKRFFPERARKHWMDESDLSNPVYDNITKNEYLYFNRMNETMMTWQFGHRELLDQKTKLPVMLGYMYSEYCKKWNTITVEEFIANTYMKTEYRFVLEHNNYVFHIGSLRGKLSIHVQTPEQLLGDTFKNKWTFDVEHGYLTSVETGIIRVAMCESPEDILKYMKAGVFILYKIMQQLPKIPIGNQLIEIEEAGDYYALITTSNPIQFDAPCSRRHLVSSVVNPRVRLTKFCYKNLNPVPVDEYVTARVEHVLLHS